MYRVSTWPDYRLEWKDRLILTFIAPDHQTFTNVIKNESTRPNFLYLCRQRIMTETTFTRHVLMKFWVNLRHGFAFIYDTSASKAEKVCITRSSQKQKRIQIQQDRVFGLPAPLNREVPTPPLNNSSQRTFFYNNRLQAVNKCRGDWHSL